MPAAPILILLPASPVLHNPSVLEGGVDGEAIVLGLPLARRAVLAARRAGYGGVFLLVDEKSAPAGVSAIAQWSDLTASGAPLVIASSAIVAEVGWLETLSQAPIEPAAWAIAPGRLAAIGAVSAREALTALGAQGGARDLSAVEARLTARLGAPAGLTTIDPLVVSTNADLSAAERRLMGALVKDTDGFMARHVERPISLQISRLLAPTSITPNQMSLISIAVGLCGAPFFLSAHALWQTIGALLFLAHSILDGCDGELARLKFQESRWGGVLDFWGDNIVHTAIFACMALGWGRAAASSWPLWLGAGAVLGTLGSAGFVYWRLMRVKQDGGALFTSVSSAPERPLARLLDAASRRDFIYLVVILALFGHSNWFLVMAGIGAPIYFALVVGLALRERGPKVAKSHV
jgi:1L-myo-inositol 1-phosphate cytidylyltransferase / CDP-L-myo-inositol myo-inositolphosphotransferase